jgi:hypothetical protein
MFIFETSCAFFAHASVPTVASRFVEIPQIVAFGAESESKIEARAFLTQKIAQETRCAIMAIDLGTAEE